jgi:hypothetical protein
MEKTTSVAALCFLLAFFLMAAGGPVGIHDGLSYVNSVSCPRSNQPALLNFLFGGNAVREFRKEQKRILVGRSGRQSTRSHKCHFSGGVEPHVHAPAIGPI